MRACDPLVVSKRKRARDISRSRFVSIFERRAACTAEESRKEGGKRRAINRRARNARNAAGHGAARDRDRSCQMPSNRFVSCHPVRLWWITFVVPRTRKCAIFPSLLFSIRSRFVPDSFSNAGLRSDANATVIFALFECRSLRSRPARGRGGDAHARHRLIQVSIVGRVRATRYRFSL